MDGSEGAVKRTECAADGGTWPKETMQKHAKKDQVVIDQCEPK